jgi:hypothetical protein
MTKDIYICYSNKDIDVAGSIAAVLENKGIRCWNYGRDAAIYRAFEIMVVILSRNTYSEWVVREVAYAKHKGIRIIPFRIEDINPTDELGDYLSGIPLFDAITPPLEEHLERLADTIIKDLGMDSQSFHTSMRTTLDDVNSTSRETNDGHDDHLRVIDSFEVQGASSKGLIQFCVGDLTRADSNHRVDVLVVSAFKDAYYPAPGSLIGALDQKGISVEALAKEKEVDLRQAFSCWISHEISDPPQGIQFKRILCYEPDKTAQAAELVGDIFRSLAPFLGGQFPIRSVATPLVASGFQQVAAKEILQQLVESAMHWMISGLPIDCLKIVCLPNNNVAELTSLFSELKSRHSEISHKDTREVDIFEQTLLDYQKDLRIFIDRKILKTGSAWQREIFESIDDCQKVAVFYSPSYLDSKVCLEEFNIALCRHRESEEPILVPIYLYSANLPTYMRLVQFYDCREFDETKIHKAALELVNSTHD